MKKQMTWSKPLLSIPTDPDSALAHLVTHHGWTPQSPDVAMIQAHRYAHGVDGRPDLADHNLSHTHSRPEAAGPPMPPTKKTSKAAWALVGLAVFVMIGVAMGNADEESGGGASAPKDQSSMAYIMCKESVKDHLKAPSTATFRNFYEKDGEVSVSGFGNGPFRISSTVDAQNSFGAKIRTAFTCTATHLGGDRWSVSSTLLD